MTSGLIQMTWILSRVIVWNDSKSESNAILKRVPLHTILSYGSSHILMPSMENMLYLLSWFWGAFVFSKKESIQK